MIEIYWGRRGLRVIITGRQSHKALAPLPPGNLLGGKKNGNRISGKGPGSPAPGPIAAGNFLLKDVFSFKTIQTSDKAVRGGRQV
jgi:hypothetical protein